MMDIYIAIVMTLILILEVIILWKRKPRGLSHKVLFGKQKKLTVDLTLMYGEGKEPTVQQFIDSFPQDYYVFEMEEVKEKKNRGKNYTQKVKGNNNIQIM